MLRKMISFILLMTLSLTCFSQLIVIAGFEFNKTYIAEHLCVNKDRPEMNCEGSCFLHQKLQQNQERQDQGQTSNMAALSFVLFTPQSFLSVLPITQDQMVYFVTNSHLPTSPSYDFFNPPRV